MVKGLPRKPLLTRDYRAPLSAKVFSAWDFCIHVQEAAIIKKHEISNEFKVRPAPPWGSRQGKPALRRVPSFLQVELEEGQRFLQVQQQSRAQRACQLLTHLRVNLLFGLLVVGAISAIFWATKYSQDHKEVPG